MNNFILNIINSFYIKYIILGILKYTCIVLLLNIFFYYKFFIDLKNSMILNFESLTDFTCLHYPDILNEMELNYFILSYKLNIRFILKIFLKKEDLIISLNKIFLNCI
jgi:NADH:ubiquinone oxidoreductase subunit C